MGPFARGSRFPKTLRGKAALNTRHFFAERKRRNGHGELKWRKLESPASPRLGGAALRPTCESVGHPPSAQAINYAQNRASFRSGEIRILDSSGNVERVIPFNDTNRKL
jgi:hypothetical protein